MKAISLILAGLMGGAGWIAEVAAQTDITAPNGGSSGLISASPSANAAYIFDNDPATEWSPAVASLPVYAQYQFTNGQEFAVYSYKIWGDKDSGQGTRSPRDFYLSGSSNGSDWVLLDSRTGQTGWGIAEARTFLFTNYTPYSYFRLTITTNGGALGGVTLSEMELYALGSLAAPSNPTPADAATSVLSAPTLTWSSAGLSNDVYVSDQTPLLPADRRTNLLTQSFLPGVLDYQRQYYWQIVTWIGSSSATSPVWSFTTTNAPPALTAYDGFENATLGTLNAQGGAGNGWEGAWTAVTAAHVVATSLFYQAGAVTLNGGNKAIRISTVESYTVLRRNFTPQETGAIYFSLLIQGSAPVGDLLSAGLKFDTPSECWQSAGFQFAYEGNTINAELYSADDKLRVSSGVTPSNNTLYFLVARIERVGVDLDYERVSLLVNPTTKTEPALGWTTATFPAVDLDRLQRFNLRTWGMDAGDLYLIDEIRIGTSYAAVVPVFTTPGIFIEIR